MDEDLLNIDLPKWPFMQVKGEKVTIAQAGEILLATTCGGYDLLTKFFKLPYDYGYLSNHRLPSHQMWGWCHWDGTIKANSWNIGKYPNVSEVLEEWEEIARKFPFLTLRCQLFGADSAEIQDDPSLLVPLVEFRVEKGRVSLHLPSEPLFAEVDPNELIETHEVYGKTIDVPWDIWAPAVSAIARSRGITPEELGDLMQEIWNCNQTWSFWKFQYGGSIRFDAKVKVWEDYALAKGWISKPPQVLNCWAMREASKALGGC